MQSLAVIAQHHRCGAAEDHPVAAFRPLEDDLLSHLAEVPIADGLGGRCFAEGLADRRQSRERAGQHATRDPVMCERGSARDGEARGDLGGDQTVHEGHAQTLRQFGSDLAATGTVGGREGDQTHRLMFPQAEQAETW